MDQEDSPFIAGIYNYCDRWCERCQFTDRCEVYAREQRQWERHLLRGENPDDPEVFMQDLHETLDETVQMLEQIAAEEGVDLDSLPPPPEPPRDEAAPLRARTERWSERVGTLLERVRTDLPGIGADLAAALSDREEAEGRAALEGLKDAYELLGRYQFLILVKTIRALGSRPTAEEESHPVLSEFAWNDSHGTAKLVHVCHGFGRGGNHFARDRWNRTRPPCLIVSSHGPSLNLPSIATPEPHEGSTPSFAC
jgi:hypothetical protein